MQEHMVDAESARPGHLSQVLSRVAVCGVCRSEYAFSDSDCILCAMQAALPLPLVQPRVDTIDAALLFVDMYDMVFNSFAQLVLHLRNQRMCPRAR